jgi:MoxR-like ATPase
MTHVDPDRFAAAAERFRAFFEELSRTFVEREDVLQQVALALLGREHVLMTGPPGTAKSQVASSVLARIVDETTGAPSLYTRQLTESTVQTDLIGPINFKTLMETGHTEHFTDEGMLGAVHAFLDEVLDGRDMLLRSVLNVLQERELKHGNRITVGRIECALMTTNRYLAEVLEGSRETLLAFVDRIAFLGFVPKGFADPQNMAQVLRRQVGPSRRPKLEATLTIQDLDALQHAVESVEVSDAVCDGLAQMLAMLDAELAAAARADPSFIATRYVSTRTAVRAARVLRAVCVFKRIFLEPDRTLVVHHDDLAMLRLFLVLAGPGPEAVATLLARETDPRERRQLEIVRLEREIFERCFAKLAPIKSAPRPPKVDVGALERAMSSAVATKDPRKLSEAAKGLADAAGSGSDGADRAAEALAASVRTLAERAIRAGMTAGIDPAASLDQSIGELATIAASLEQAATTTRPAARWVRGRALSILDEAAALLPGTPTDLSALIGQAKSESAIVTQVEERLFRLEQLAATRARLIAAGADGGDDASSRERWTSTIGRSEELLGILCDTGLRNDIANVLHETPADRLGEVLERLGPSIDALRAVAARLARLAEQPASLERRVLAPRLRPLLSAAFQRLEAIDRATLVHEVDKVMAVLERAGLVEALDPGDLVGWAATALVRVEQTRAAPAPHISKGYDGYLELRLGEARIPLTYTLVEIALRTCPSLAHPKTPDAAMRGVADVVHAVPEGLRAELSGLELARIGRALAYLETWWTALVGNVERGGELDTTRLETVARSRFLAIAHDDATLTRFSLEARLVGEILPERADEVNAMRARIAQLEASITSAVTALLHARADAKWSEVLGSS